MVGISGGMMAIIHLMIKYPIIGVLAAIVLAGNELGGNVVAPDFSVTWQAVESLIPGGIADLSVAISGVLSSSLNLL
ncbi:MAG: hypothetical protein WCH05_05000 [Chlorobiaceae bacterium]